MEKLINKPDIEFKKVKRLVFLFVFLLIIDLILFSKIVVEVKKVEFSSAKKQHLNNEYIILIKWYILNKLPIIVMKIDKKKIEKLKIEAKLEKVGTMLITDKNQFDKNFLELSKKILKKLKINVAKVNLQVEYGTENAALTAILLPFFSTACSFFIKSKEEKTHKYRKRKETKKLIKFSKRNKKQKNKKAMPYYFKINPIFKNQNIIKFWFSGIFELKIINIINSLYFLSKQEKIEKSEKLSTNEIYSLGYE